MSYSEVYGGEQEILFNVASLAKPVTASITLKRVEQDLLSLDEPLYPYWVDTDLARDSRVQQLTPRILRSHQSGFKNWRGVNANDKLHFEFDPGNGYTYSGEGYEYLRRTLERKFDKNFQKLTEEVLFLPFGLTDTKYVWSSDLDTLRYAYNYNENGEVYPIVKRKEANAADDLLTTVDDYARFLTLLINGSLLPRYLFDEMSASQVPSEKGKYFGLGLEIYDFGEEGKVLAHGGADDGVRTIFFLIPKTKNGLLIVTNSDTGGNLYVDLVEHFLDQYGQKIMQVETN